MRYVSRIAALKPVIEFPDYIFTQIPEARHLPSTISVDKVLIMTIQTLRLNDDHTIGMGYGKTPAQVVLNWNIELGIVTIPRSSNPERLVQNLNIFDFSLTPTSLLPSQHVTRGAEKRADSDTGAIDPRAIERKKKL